MKDIEIGNTVTLKRPNYLNANGKIMKVDISKEYEIVNIFFEAYISDYKTVVEVKSKIEGSNLWLREKLYINDFFSFLVNEEE